MFVIELQRFVVYRLQADEDVGSAGPGHQAQHFRIASRFDANLREPAGHAHSRAQEPAQDPFDPAAIGVEYVVAKEDRPVLYSNRLLDQLDGVVVVGEPKMAGELVYDRAILTLGRTPPRRVHDVVGYVFDLIWRILGERQTR